jgi:hypothetical protein
MKFISTGRKYIYFENDKTDDYEALVWAQEILEKIALNMDKNSTLASDDYNLGVTKEDILEALAVFDLLTEYGNCYIEYEEEN